MVKLTTSYFAIFKQGLTLVQTSSCKSLDFFEVTLFPYEPYLQKKYAELIRVSEAIGSIDICILCTLYISNQIVVLANIVFTATVVSSTINTMVFFSLESLKKPGEKVMWIWLEIRQDIEDCN